MAYLTSTTATGIPFGERIRALILDAFIRVKRQQLYRATFSGLSALSNRELADLGLNRSELRHVAKESARNATL